MAKSTPAFDFASCYSLIETLAKSTTLKLNDDELTKLTTIVEMLNTWNSALNLTAIKKVDEMVVLHILDSAVVSPIVSLDKSVKDVADVGTGAGFPGLVLAILNPEINFTLIDSVGKKLSFVRQVASRLGLKNVEIINKRCEEIKDREFNLITSRAFAPIERMVNWCLPLLKDTGAFVAMKAHLEEDELSAIPKTVKIEKIVKLQVPSLDATRQAVILRHAAFNDPSAFDAL